MKTTQTIAALFIACAAAGNATAEPLIHRFDYIASPEAFRAEEWQLDFFGIYASRDRDNFDEDTWGIGIGGNYFFTEKLGLSLDSYVADADWPKHIESSFIGRYPLFERYQLSLAPYGFVGFGRQFIDVSQWTAHIGGGIEYRMNPATGVFLDTRWIFADQTEDIMVWRFGIRLVF